jgi:LPXTG-site transpeptidase (sortase) family protein
VVLLVIKRAALAASVGVAVLVLAFGGFLAVQAYHPFGASTAGRAGAVTPIISSYPAALGPRPNSSTSHENLRVSVPELNIDLPVVEGDGYDAPLYQAAHYPGMAWPGEGGRSVIYAHARKGMFGPLFAARVGQHVQVSAPQGTRKYVVTEYYPRWPITDLKWLRPADHEELILITCTTYNYNDPRIIVVAQPQ